MRLEVSFKINGKVCKNSIEVSDIEPRNTVAEIDCKIDGLAKTCKMMVLEELAKYTVEELK
jgi:hypothetical protein